MRCLLCGWSVRDSACPCGETRPGARPDVAVHAPVAARPGRGPSLLFWSAGEVVERQGPLYKVKTRAADFWCDGFDLLAESAERTRRLQDGTRVWALWLDGRWYPGTVDGVEGRLRHVTWDDGDALWLEPWQLVLLVREAGPPQVDTVVLAPRWDGAYQPARVEQQDGRRYRVTFFSDEEEAWVEREELRTFPANPFHD